MGWGGGRAKREGLVLDGVGHNAAFEFEANSRDVASAVVSGLLTVANLV